MKISLRNTKELCLTPSSNGMGSKPNLSWIRHIYVTDLASRRQRVNTEGGLSNFLKDSISTFSIPHHSIVEHVDQEIVALILMNMRTMCRKYGFLEVIFGPLKKMYRFFEINCNRF